MTCPKCGHVQKKSDSCAKCGVIVTKISSPSPRTEPAPPPALHDEIPGLKGTLIRFIERSITTLMDGVRNE